MSDAVLHPMVAPAMPVHHHHGGAKRLFRALVAARGAPAEPVKPEEHELQDIGLARGAVPGEAWGLGAVPR